ncbi:MAG: DNA polymerase III subunit gamma/tau [Myxococcaceae bacterium]|nr:DNA polymerase III subunit gamma/tau [Myxococcaceae bacterium]
MSYTVLARKYRPQAFEEMTGQEHVVRTVENAIKLDRVAHAYLFAGPRGVGKTTAARLLARALNCEKGPTANPCGACRACTEIRDGISTDVQEIDGASNNGVENVREIRENAKYQPQRDRYKIYIIDEVHMLSGAAFNALLKTLEEPPGHVKFIFATTEAHKLPDTILSRCQRHNFRRISQASMLKRLKEIAQAEQVKVSESALSLIVRQSEGGMRDALSLLDQILSACGNEPKDEDVAETLGTIDRTVVHGIAKALVTRDAAIVLKHTEELWNRGVDLRRLAEELAWWLRHLFVARATGAAPDELADTDREAVVALARDADAAQLARLFDVVHTGVWEIARAPQPRLAFEMTLLKALHLAPAASIPELVARVERLASGQPVAAGAPGGRSTSAPFRA